MLLFLFGIFMIQAMIRMSIWHGWVVAYSEGMSVYRIENWKGRYEFVYMIRAMISEMREVLEAIILGRPLEVILELCDVWHAFLCTIAILLLGVWSQYQGVYYILYTISPYTAWKHGNRYRDYQCVRSLNNHKGEIDHVCTGDMCKIKALMTLQTIKVEV